jgi:hypothetical protein
MSVEFALCLLTLFFLAGIGTPVAYSILLASFVYLAAGGQGVGIAGKVLMDGLYQSFILLAVPLFIVAANIMNAGTISDRLLQFCVAAVGPVPGRARPRERRGLADLFGDVRFGGRGCGRHRQDHHRDDDEERALHPGLRRRDHRRLGDHRADHPALDPDGALRARQPIPRSARCFSGIVPGLMMGVVLMAMNGVHLPQAGFALEEPVPLRGAAAPDGQRLPGAC